MLLLAGGCAPTVAPRETEPQAEAPVETDDDPVEVKEEVDLPESDAPIMVEEAPIETVVVDSIPESIRIGLLLPLTGRASRAGTDMLNAAQMAVFETYGEDVALVPFDTGGTPEGAAQAAEAALDQNAGLILGPLLSTSVGPVAAVAKERGVNVITFSNVAGVAGDNVFQLGIRPEEEVGHAIAFAARRGLTRFALLVPQNDYGQAVVQAATLSSGLVRGEITRIEFFGAGSNDVTGPVENLSRVFGGPEVAAFDAVLVAAGPRQMRAIAPLFPYFDLDPDVVQLLGMASWRDPMIQRQPGLHGAWFPSVARQGVDDFETDYERLYGGEPLMLASLSYDAVALAGALARVPDGKGFSPEMLTAGGGFVGKTGLFRFRKDGLAQRGMAIFQVGPDDYVEIDPPPTSFTPPAF